MLHPLCWKQGGQIHFVILKQVLYSLGVFIFTHFYFPDKILSVIQSYGQHWSFRALSKDGMFIVTEVDFLTTS